MCGADIRNRATSLPPGNVWSLERLRLGLVFRRDTRLEGLDGRSNVASGAVTIHDER